MLEKSPLIGDFGGNEQHYEERKNIVITIRQISAVRSSLCNNYKSRGPPGADFKLEALWPS